MLAGTAAQLVAYFSGPLQSADVFDSDTAHVYTTAAIRHTTERGGGFKWLVGTNPRASRSGAKFPAAASPVIRIIKTANRQAIGSKRTKCGRGMPVLIVAIRFARRRRGAFQIPRLS